MELKSTRFIVLEIMQVLWQRVESLGGHFRFLSNRNGVVTWGGCHRQIELKKKKPGREKDREKDRDRDTEQGDMEWQKQ